MVAIGVSLSVPPPPPAVAVDPGWFAAQAERLGFESVWVGEHVTAPVECSSDSPVFPGGQVPGFFDPFVALGRASAMTTTLRLGFGVLLVPEHHPVRLAKAIATLDALSEGRVVVGVGVGWNIEERSIMGGEGERPWAQTREAVEAMKAQWTQEVAEFHGEFYDFPKLRCFPPPASTPHPPILIGGTSAHAPRRAAQWGNGIIAQRASAADLAHRVAELRHHAVEAGRDADAFDITVAIWEPTPAAIDDYAAAGATRVILHTRELSDKAGALRALERLAGLLGG